MPAAATTVPVSLQRLALAARVAEFLRERRTPPLAVAAPAREPLALATPRMTIRALRPADCVEFLRVLRLNREHLARFFPLARGQESDLEIFARELRLAAVGRTAGDWRRAAFGADGRLIGCFNLNAITRGLVFRAETTLWINAELAGRGLAGEGLRAVLDHAFADLPVPPVPPTAALSGRCSPCSGATTVASGLGLHRIDAFVDPDNAASRRVLERAGFRAHHPAVRIPLTISGRPRSHDLVTCYAALPALPVLEFKLLPAHLRSLMAAQLEALQLADPADDLARVIA